MIEDGQARASIILDPQSVKVGQSICQRTIKSNYTCQPFCEMSMPLPSGSCTRYSAKGMRSGRAAAYAGTLGAILHFFIALHMEPEMVKPHRFFFPLIEQG